MSLLSTIKNALGLQKQLVVRPLDQPVTLSPEALARLSELPAGQGVHFWFQEPVLHAEEGPSQGPPPAGLEQHAVTMPDATFERLAGRILDYRPHGWAVSMDLELRARETPNPNSRLYMTDWILAEHGSVFAVAGAASTGLMAGLLAIPGVHSALARDNTVTVEREPSAPWDVIDRGVDSAIRTHLLSLAPTLRPGATDSSDDSELEAAVREVIEERVLPGIHRDGGDLELIGVSAGVVRVSLHGACRSCPSSTATLHHGVERILKEAFGERIQSVEQV